MSEWLDELESKCLACKVTEDTVDFAKRFGEFLTNGGKDASLTTNQLRKFYGEVKRLQMRKFDDIKTDFILLKPKLAYAVGRAKKQNKIKDFYEVISYLIDNVKSTNDFENFIKFFEAIVAYHKFYENEKSNN